MLLMYILVCTTSNLYAIPCVCASNYPSMSLFIIMYLNFSRRGYGQELAGNEAFFEV